MFDLNLFICKTKIKFNKVNFQTLHNKKSTYFPLSNHCKNKRSFLSQKQACNNMQNLVKINLGNADINNAILILTINGDWNMLNVVLALILGTLIGLIIGLLVGIIGTMLSLRSLNLLKKKELKLNKKKSNSKTVETSDINFLYSKFKDVG